MSLGINVLQIVAHQISYVKSESEDQISYVLFGCLFNIDYDPCLVIVAGIT